MDNYWFRAVAETSCFSNTTNNGLSIFSYDGARAGNPTTTAAIKPSNCNNESPLVPWVPNTVPSDAFTSQAKSLQVDKVPGAISNGQNIIFWGVNLSSINVDWEKPIMSYILAGDTNYPSTENLIELPTSNIVSQPRKKCGLIELRVLTVDLLDYSRDCGYNGPYSPSYSSSRS